MASFPPRTINSQQRRSSQSPQDSTAAADASSSSSHLEGSRAFSTISEDSQTFNVYERTSSPKQAQEAEQASSSPVASLDTAEARDDVKKCWICLMDETEDGDSSTGWIEPCPCALTAHESCLKEFYQRRSGPVECPQCKSPIRTDRPRSYIADGVRALERIEDRLVLPVMVTGLSTIVWQTAWVHGAQTICTVFGFDEGIHIIQSLLGFDPVTRRPPIGPGALREGWRGILGLPLIPPILVLSRTGIANTVLPAIPILLIIGQPHDRDFLRIGQWPPSAPLTFSLLPYVLGAYNACYEKLFGELERGWMKEVSPQLRQLGEGNQGAEGIEIPNDLDGPDDGADGFELNLEVEIAEDVEILEDEEPQPVQQGQDQRMQRPREQERAPPLHAPPQDDRPNPVPPPNAAPAGPQRQVALRQRFNTTKIAETVIGALLFPSVASGMGEILKKILPWSWVGFNARRPGFLQTKWGRTVAGGCLFIVLKDAIMLYCKWRAALASRHMHILNYDKVKKKYIR